MGVVLTLLVFFSGNNYHIKSKEINLDIESDLRYLDNEKFSFLSIGNNDAIFYFWGSYCAPCVDKLPLLDRFSKSTNIPVIIISQESIEAQVNYLSHFDYENLEILQLTSSFKEIGVELIPKIIYKEKNNFKLISSKDLEQIIEL